MSKQHCVICAWRENCAKKFCVTDGGSRCPDFSRDISIKEVPEMEPDQEKGEKI
ncbi:MAG TPA: hypothetical protein VJ550_01760 [Geomonas sp.]|nr:hypothetical protein [Geomonas sp.]